MKHTKKRVAALLLALAMVMSLLPMAFADDDAGFPDMPAEDDASYAAVKSAVDNELLKGDDGMLKLEDSITRATMAALVTRVFGAKGEADLSTYPDVDGHWAVTSGELPAAVAMGIMNGSNGMMRPNDEVTMQEVITMLVRALGLKVDPNATLEGVEGADSVAAWAVPYVAALVKAGYISDVTGAAEPMSRVEFAEMIYKVSGEGNYVKEAAEITTDVDGNIIITADGVSLKGITVTGDVIIADGVDAGSINLDGVTIKGRLVVRGGAEASLTNGTTASETVVAKTTGEVTVKADASSKAGDIAVAGTDNGADIKIADKVVIDMAEPTVTVSTATEVAVQNAKGGEVILAASGASVSVESGTLANITVYDGATDVKVDVAANATIENITTNSDLTVTGEGTVSEVTGSGVVSDESGEVIGGGDEEPADVPTVTTPAPAPEVDPNKPTNDTHTHNWAATPVPFDATRHTFACVDTEEGADPAITGCGAKTYAAHNTDGDEVKVGDTVIGHKCTCGYNTVVTSDVTSTGDDDCAAGDHVWVALTGEAATDAGDKAATCAMAGQKSYKCSNDGCTATKVETLPATGHTLVLVSTTAATCNADGKQVYKCTNKDCDKTGENEASSIVVTIPKTNQHVWVMKTDTAATCVAARVTVYKCANNCGVTDETKTIGAPNPNAHTWGTTGTAVADTKTHTVACTNDGCGGDDGPATKTEGCSFTVAVAGDDGKAVAATCTGAGHTAVMKCSKCTNTDSKVIPALGHNWATTWASNATKHWHACRNDGCDVKNAEGDHTWSKTNEDGTPAAGAQCTTCGYKNGGSGSGGQTDTHEHSKGSTVKYDATQHWFICDGGKTGCDTTKYDAANHNFGSNATSPDGKCTGCNQTHTCDTAGTDNACSKCGYKAADQSQSG